MHHVAIDLGSRKSQVCIREADGTLTSEGSMVTQRLGEEMKGWPESLVILETCAEAFKVADQAMAAHHEVVVVPSTLAPALGVGARGIKTDVRDARKLSEVSTRIAELPQVHIPSVESRQYKSVCGMREALVGVRTKLINTVRGYLRTELITLRPGVPETLTQRVRDGYVDSEVPRQVQRQLVAIDALNEQIKAADGELATLAANDQICVRLMSVPGVGPVTAMRFRAAIDDHGRFGDAHQLESYLGLTPGEDSSSQRKRRTAITKAGARHVRWTLIQAAWVLRRTRPNDPMVVWNAEVEKRRGKKIAVVALARKLAGVLYAIWRDGTTYNAKKGADVATDA